MKTKLGSIAVKAFGGASIAVLGLAAVATTSFAETAQVIELPTRVIEGEQYVPTIWIDPDGCEHWDMDDGAEG